jgi:hypothetical protein
VSNLELIVNAVVCAFVVGVIVGGVAVHVWVAPSAARRAAADRRRLIRAQMQAYKRHAGTPYIREARPW